MTEPTPSTSSGWALPYSDRVRAPADTVAFMRQHFAALGITRLARQTGLDRVGIPCFAAFRPNSETLAANQGKGLDDDAAMASAVMEAAEYAIAERPEGKPRRASPSALAAADLRYFAPTRQMPFGSDLDPDLPITWYEGYDAFDRSMVMAPANTVSMGQRAPELSGICRTTNGLASGNSLAEAVFHGTCELVERDATSLWSLKPRPAQEALAFAADTLDDAAVSDLAARIRAAGLHLALFDQTSDIGIPTVMAVIGGGESDEARHFGVTAGYGTHPVAARAAIRAITEAAQSRVTIIAGSRDDIPPGDFRKPIDPGLAALAMAKPTAAAPRGLDLGTPLPVLLDMLLAALSDHDIDLTIVPVGGSAYGIHVVKMLSRMLEDREPNVHWRPGQRALGVLLGVAA